jgi:hypothetical protein
VKNPSPHCAGKNIIIQNVRKFHLIWNNKTISPLQGFETSLTCLTGHLCLTVTLRPAQLILLYNLTLFNGHLSYEGKRPPGPWQHRVSLTFGGHCLFWLVSFIALAAPDAKSRTPVANFTCLTGHLCLTVTLRPAQLILLYNLTLFNGHLSNAANSHLFHAWIVRSSSNNGHFGHLITWLKTVMYYFSTKSLSNT